jgi:hypothetical protein
MDGDGKGVRHKVRKYLVVAVLVTSLALALTGCGTKQAASQTPASQQPASSSQAAPTAAPAGQATAPASQPKAAAAPSSTTTTQTKPAASPSTTQPVQQVASLTGEVTSVSGSKVAMKLVKTPAGRSDGQPGGAAPASSTPPTGGPAPTGSGPQQGGTSGQTPALEYTGETKTIDIPSGVKITMMTRNSSSQGGMTETVVSTLKAGDVIQVFYSDADKTTISRVSVVRRTS